MHNGLIPNSGEMCVSYTTVTLFFFALELESKFNWCEGDGEGERRVPPGLHSLEGSLITRIKSGSGGRRRERWGRWMEGERNFGSTVWIVQKDNMGGTWGQKPMYIRRNLPMVERVFKILKLIVISPHDSIKCQSWEGFEKIAFFPSMGGC